MKINMLSNRKISIEKSFFIDLCSLFSFNYEGSVDKLCFLCCKSEGTWIEIPPIFHLNTSYFIYGHSQLLICTYILGCIEFKRFQTLEVKSMECCFESPKPKF